MRQALAGVFPLCGFLDMAWPQLWRPAGGSTQAVCPCAWIVTTPGCARQFRLCCSLDSSPNSKGIAHEGIGYSSSTTVLYAAKKCNCLYLRLLISARDLNRQNGQARELRRVSCRRIWTFARSAMLDTSSLNGRADLILAKNQILRLGGIGRRVPPRGSDCRP